MTTAFRSELIKFRQSTYWIGVAALIAFMAITMVISIGSHEVTADRGPAGLVLALSELEAQDGLGRSLGNAVTFLGIAVLAIVAINVGGEYGYGTVRNIVVRQPHRGRLLAGKSVALLAYVAVAVGVAALCGALLATLLAPGAGVDGSEWWTGAGILATLGGVANLVLACCGWATFGLLLAIALRSAPATIGMGVAYALPVEILVGEISGAAARWLPGQILQSLARGGATGVDYPIALAGTVIWIILTLGAALMIFRAREISD